jgi:hypothetical protein
MRLYTRLPTQQRRFLGIRRPVVCARKAAFCIPRGGRGGQTFVTALLTFPL